jgi:GT2 family glycosyltransferase
MSVSVVVPTKDRIDVLRKTVGALAAQDLDGFEAELLVVDNGSTDDTVEWLREAANDLPVPLRVLIEPAPGVSAARNTAVREARHETILFLNDDTVPRDAGLLAGHITAHRQAGREIAVLGRISYRPKELANPLLLWLNDHGQFAYRQLEAGESPGVNHFYTAHISFPRRSFLAAGGMDERLGFGFEDAALGRRLAAEGVGIEYHRELLVHHLHPMAVADLRRRGMEMGKAGRRVNDLYPSEALLADRATTPFWTLAMIGERALATLPGELKRLPSPLREWCYSVIYLGSYARGYRTAAGG